MGFEPTIGCYPYNGLANRRLQPLGHPSTEEWVHGACPIHSSERPRPSQLAAGANGPYSENMTIEDGFARLLGEIRGCTLCAARLPLGPRPIVRGEPAARLLVI